MSGLTGAPVVAVGNRAVPAEAAGAGGAGVTPGVGESTTVGAEATRPSAGTVCAGATGVAVGRDNDAAATAATTGAAAATTPGASGAIQVQGEVDRGATSASGSRDASGGSGCSATASAAAGSSVL